MAINLLPFKERVHTERGLSFKAKLDSRKKILAKLKAALEKSEAELVQALYKDFKKPEAEVWMSELLPVYAEIKHSMDYLEDWMQPEYVATPLHLLGTESYFQAEPLGATLIIGPWNYPFYLVMSPLISAVSAGNTAVVKPSEMTPNTSQFILKLLTSVFEKDQVAVVLGGKEETTELLKLDFDFIFFTGSEKVGRIVGESAAKKSIPFALELGGKSPLVVLDDAKLDENAAAFLFGKWINSGQTCVAPDTVYVPVKMKDAFISALKKVAISFGDDPGSRSAILSQVHFDRLTRLVSEAKAAGAEVVELGKTNAATLHFYPTIVCSSGQATTAIQNEEIFGPVFSMVTYSDLKSDVIAPLQKGAKPLALYVWGSKRSDEVVSQVPAGGVCVNTSVIHVLNLDLPFGGVKNSGFGKCHGVFGFKTFSHEKSVLKKTFFNSSQMLYPPYTARTLKIIKALKRFLF